MKKTSSFFGLFLCLGILVCTETRASLLVFEDEASWRAFVGETPMMEDFESFTEDTEFRTGPVQIQGMLVSAGITTTNPTTTNLIDVPPLVLSGFEDINGSVSLAGNIDGPSRNDTTVSFAFDEPLVAWGTTIRGLSGSLSPFELFDSVGVSLGVFSQTPTTEVGFIGFAFDDSRAASRLVISHNGASNDFFRMDNVLFVAKVPEPNTLILLGFGLVGIRLAQRKRAARRSWITHEKATAQRDHHFL